MYAKKDEVPKTTVNYLKIAVYFQVINMVEGGEVDLKEGQLINIVGSGIYRVGKKFKPSLPIRIVLKYKEGDKRGEYML